MSEIPPKKHLYIVRGYESAFGPVEPSKDEIELSVSKIYERRLNLAQGDNDKILKILQEMWQTARQKGYILLAAHVRQKVEELVGKNKSRLVLERFHQSSKREPLQGVQMPEALIRLLEKLMLIDDGEAFEEVLVELYTNYFEYAEVRNAIEAKIANSYGYQLTEHIIAGLRMRAQRASVAARRAQIRLLPQTIGDDETWPDY